MDVGGGAGVSTLALYLAKNAGSSHVLHADKLKRDTAFLDQPQMGQCRPYILRVYSLQSRVILLTFRFLLSRQATPTSWLPFLQTFFTTILILFQKCSLFTTLRIDERAKVHVTTLHPVKYSSLVKHS